MKKRNVLIVINLFVSAESFLGDQLKYLNDIGYNIHLICSPHENLSKFAIKQGIHFAPLKLARQFSFIDDIKAYFFLCRYIKKNNIDTVIAHQAKSRLLGILASVSMNVPHRIIYAHGALFETMTGIKQKIMIQMDKFISSLSHKVVCVSSSVANLRLKLGIDIV